MSAKDQLWIEAAKRYRLSHEQVRMARELGMNPKKLGGLANHRQERWKVPLPEFIEDLYAKRLRKKRPDAARPSAHMLDNLNHKKAAGGDRIHIGEQRQQPDESASDSLDDVPF